MEPFDREGAPVDALRKASDDLARAKKSGDKKAECLATLAIADATLDKDGPEAALAECAEARELAARLGLEDARVTALQLATKIHIAGGQANEAMGCAWELHELAQKLGDKETVALAHCVLARAHLAAKSGEAALKDATSAMSIYRDRGDVKAQSATLLLLAEVQDMCGDDEEAERSVKYALKLARDAGWGRGASKALDTLAQLYIGIGQYTQARKLAEEEIATFRKLGDKRGEAMALKWPVLALLASDNYNETLETAEMALDSLIALGERMEEGRIMLAMATAYASMGQAQAAISMVQQCTEIFQKLGDREGSKSTLELLTRVHEAKGLEAPASSFRDVALDLLVKLAHTFKEQDGGLFDAVAELMHGSVGFLTDKDLKSVLGPWDREGLLDFVRDRAPSQVVGRVLEAAEGRKAEVGLPGVGPSKRPPVRFIEADKEFMYGSLRAGGLVYGPRFRMCRSFLPKTGFLIVHAAVRPCSHIEDWEMEGWDWNPEPIDNGAHAGFAMAQAAM